MSCCGNPYNPMFLERDTPAAPYGQTPYYQQQAATPGMIPAMSPGMASGMIPGMTPGMTPSMIPGMTPAMTLPSGVPSGPPFGGIPVTIIPPSAPAGIQIPQTLQNPYYLAGKLRDYIGRDVRVEFLLGTSGPLTDRIGTLLEVGASYIIIKPIRTDDTLVCDLYSIRFVTVYA